MVSAEADQIKNTTIARLFLPEDYDQVTNTALQP